MLTGKALPLQGIVHQKWRISVETEFPDKSKIRTEYDNISCFTCTLLTLPLFVEQSLKDILIGGKSGSNISMSPLLLFSGGRGTDTRLS